MSLLASTRAPLRTREASGDEPVQFLLAEGVKGMQQGAGLHAQTGQLGKTKTQEVMNSSATGTLQLTAGQTN